MKPRLLLPLLLVAITAGCGSDDPADLRAFMEETGRDGKVKMDALPPVLPPDTFEYRADGLEDPFKARNLQGRAGAF